MAILVIGLFRNALKTKIMQLLIFKYEDDSHHLNDLTTVEIDGEVWFVAADVCALLGLDNPTKSIATLDEDEKLTYPLRRAGQLRTVNLINESGLYALIFKSKKESAKKFRKWVTKEVLPSIRKKGVYGIDRSATPNFVIRYNANWHKLDNGYFSVITELFVRLYMRFEKEGYQIPNKALDGKEIRPDASVGKCFANYLRISLPEQADNFKTYPHKFPNGLEVEARQYPIDLLPDFIRYVDNVWIPNNAEAYFKQRDIKALDYLPKLLRA
jgi:prophage antirepressor-like protein